MKQSGIFDRVQFLEARLDRLEAVILAQDAALRALRAEEKPPEHLEPTNRRMSKIALEVAADNNLTLAEMRTPSRTFAVSRPRQYAMLLMSEAGFSQAAIARFFHMKCHTSVGHGISAARARAVDPS